MHIPHRHWWWTCFLDIYHLSIARREKSFWQVAWTVGFGAYVADILSLDIRTGILFLWDSSRTYLTIMNYESYINHSSLQNAFTEHVWCRYFFVIDHQNVHEYSAVYWFQLTIRIASTREKPLGTVELHFLRASYFRWNSAKVDTSFAGHTSHDVDLDECRTR